jgi:hypothetical protein
MPFTSRNDLLVRTRDGRNVTLQEPLEFVTAAGVRYRVPAGATSDGLSTPREVWFSIPPFGTAWLAGVLHDAAYRDALERQQGAEWVKAGLSKTDSDALLLEGMQTLGVDTLEMQTIYRAVCISGGKAFREDRAK